MRAFQNTVTVGSFEVRLRTPSETPPSSRALLPVRLRSPSPQPPTHPPPPPQPPPPPPQPPSRRTSTPQPPTHPPPPSIHSLLDRRAVPPHVIVFRQQVAAREALRKAKKELASAENVSARPGPRPSMAPSLAPSMAPPSSASDPVAPSDPRLGRAQFRNVPRSRSPLRLLRPSGRAGWLSEVPLNADSDIRDIREGDVLGCLSMPASQWASASILGPRDVAWLSRRASDPSSDSGRPGPSMRPEQLREIEAAKPREDTDGSEPETKWLKSSPHRRQQMRRRSGPYK